MFVNFDRLCPAQWHVASETSQNMCGIDCCCCCAPILKSIGVQITTPNYRLEPCCKATVTLNKQGWQNIGTANVLGNIYTLVKREQVNKIKTMSRPRG